MKLSSQLLAGLAVTGGALAQQTIELTTTIVIPSSYTGPSYAVTVPVNTYVPPPPAPTTYVSPPSYSQAPGVASVVSYLSDAGQSAAMDGQPVTTTTYVANGIPYTIVIPVHGSTTVVPVVGGGSTVYETIVIQPTAAGAAPSSTHSAATGTVVTSVPVVSPPTSSGAHSTASGAATSKAASSTTVTTVTTPASTSSTAGPATLSTTAKPTATATATVGPVPPAGSGAQALGTSLFSAALLLAGSMLALF